VGMEVERCAKRDIDVNLWAVNIAVEVLGYCIYGIKLGLIENKTSVLFEEYKKIFGYPTILEIFPFLSKIPFFPPTKKLHNAIDNNGKFIQSLIESKKQNLAVQDNDFLSSLLKASSSEISPLSDTELTNEAFSFWLAGQETTAHAIIWILYELTAHPELQDKLYHQIISKFGKDGDPTLEEMDQISPDLNNFIYETARIHHAVAPILPSRVADQDLNFNGITIPKGSLLGVNATTIHLHPQYWDDPDQFNPDRWLKENKQAEKKT